MKRYAYKVLRGSTTDVQKKMNDAGEQGWRVVTFIYDGNNYDYVTVMEREGGEPERL